MGRWVGKGNNEGRGIGMEDGAGAGAARATWTTNEMG